MKPMGARDDAAEADDGGGGCQAPTCGGALMTDGPLNLLMGENWLVWHFWNPKSQLSYQSRWP